MAGLIQVEDLTFGYRRDKILYEDLCLQVQKGEWIGLTGYSGQGKTTLLRLINGSIKKGGMEGLGKIIVLGRDMLKEDHIPGDVMTVYQNPEHQLVFTDGMDELLFGMENFSYTPNDMTEQIENIIRDLDIKDIIHKNPANLSGGEKQLMVLGAVLCLNSSILLLDEAFSAVDERRVSKILSLLKERHQKGLTIVMVDHKKEHLVYADRVLELKDKSLYEMEREGI